MEIVEINRKVNDHGNAIIVLIRILSCSILMVITTSVNAQVSLQISGSITIGNDEIVTPSNGMIEWNGTELRGRLNGQWVILGRRPHQDLTNTNKIKSATAFLPKDSEIKKQLQQIPTPTITTTQLSTKLPKKTDL